MFLIRLLIWIGLTCLTMLSVTQTRVQVSVETRRDRRPCVFSQFISASALDRLLAGRTNAAALLEWDSRTARVCSFSRPRAEGTMVTVTQQYVVIRLIEHDAGFRCPKFR
jgi:hypothetical protein